MTQQNSGAASRDASGRPADTPDLARYGEALRKRFPGPEEIFRLAARRKRARKVTTTAGCTAALFALLATLWAIDPVYRSEQFATAIGEKKAHTLADGSEVTLNTGSVLTVEWRLRSRRLQLEHGEALFRVAHGTRDFVVKAQGATIRDIGTAFNVHLDKQSAIVTVLEGAVEVRAGDARAVLETNQAVSATTGRLGAPGPADPAPATAWQRGKLTFDGTLLSAAVAEMQRYRKSPIVLRDEAAGSLRLSGEFDTQRIDALLDLLPVILPVTLRREPDGSAIIHAQKK